MEGKRGPPLLVKIQNIDISTLDFHSKGGGGGTASKSRHVTYVEGTNLFLFIGSTSGTVYLFSRDSLNFLFMIPFKGGKVCNIAVSSDESEVAVASIRGKVSIYRMSANLHLLESQSSIKKPLNSSSGPGDAFKHLYDIPHHVPNEITEMQWSPNGNFLFIGDSQGVISQVDVASLEEFPRPPPSRIILKLQSRILQINCAFPYLAICSLNETCLCDLEKEDFTRIHSPITKSDIKAAGISLIVLDNGAVNVNGDDEEMTLFISELSSNRIYRCGMDGSVKSSELVKLPGNGLKRPLKLFDPKLPHVIDISTASEDDHELNFIPGKLFTTEDGFLLSVSSDRIFIFDPKESKSSIMAWNDTFNRINSFKIISSYGFLWYGNKFQVFALTPFRSYGKQLLKAGLSSVLQSWIAYAVSSVGWRGATDEDDKNLSMKTMGNDNIEEDDENKSTPSDDDAAAVDLFRLMMTPIIEEDEFCDFIASHLPFNLIEPKPEPELSQEELHEKLFRKSFHDLEILISNSSYDLVEEESEPLVETISKFMESCQGIQNFYEKLGIEELHVLELKKSELNLVKVLHSAAIYLKSPQFTTLRSDLIRYSMTDSIQDKIIVPILSHCKCIMDSCRKEQLPHTMEGCNFFKVFAQCPVILKYFRELGISKDNVLLDAFVADVILLLLPLIGLGLGTSPVEDEVINSFGRILEEKLKLKVKVHSMFFSWLTMLSFLNDKTHEIPYGSLLRPIQHPQIFEKLAEEILSTIIRDAFALIPTTPKTMALSMYSFDSDHNNDRSLIKLLPNFITFVILFSKASSDSILDMKMKQRGFELLLHLFPMKRNGSKEISDKLIELNVASPVLLKMFQKACLEDGKSLRLCSCVLPACYGSLENKVPPYQRAIEEAILNILLDNYLSSDTLNPEDTTEVNKQNTLKRNPLHLLAMRRCLVQKYLESAVSDEILSDHDKIKLILRSGLCASLQYLKFNMENLKLIREALKMSNVEGICTKCAKVLDVGENKVLKIISMDCVGVWIAESVGSTARFMNIVQKINLNNVGEFSLRFYKYLVTRDHLRKTKKEDSGFGDLVSLSNLTCSVLH